MKPLFVHGCESLCMSKGFSIYNNMELIKVQGQNVVSHEQIAKGINVQPKNTKELIEKYKNEVERFGTLAFKTRVVKSGNGAGIEKKVYYLNEQQATFLLTLSRNTEQVVNFKSALVSKFFELREKEQARQNARLECKDMTDAIKQQRELEGKEAKSFHYSNEHNLIYKIVLGVTKKKYVETFELEPNSLRDQLPTQHIKAIEHMQRLNTSLIEIGMDYYKRKEQLNKVFNQKFAKLIEDEINLIEG